MSFDIDVRLTRGDARIAARVEAGPGITVLFGPSGAGKTSVLSMVAGLLTPDSGHIRVAGRTLFDAQTDLPPERRACGYVFQDARLFPHMRVRENLAYGHRAAPDASEIPALLGIDGLMTRWPRSLSGGEVRRVAIARALMAQSRFLLLDEPLSSLDRARAEEIMALIERIRDDLRLPMLYVTHDRAEAERLASRIVTLERA